MMKTPLLSAPMSRRALLVGSASTLVAACASAPKPRTSILDFTITVDRSVNPNENGNPSPIVMRIYELKSDTTFNSLDFFTLYDNDTAALGADMIGRREFELMPSSKSQMRTETSYETQYVGVIAGFRDINSSTWRASKQITREKMNMFLVNVTALAVELDLSLVTGKPLLQ